MVNVLKGNTGMEQKIQKTQRQLSIYQSLQGKEQIISITTDVLLTIVGFITGFIFHPVAGLVGGALGYCISRYVIDKQKIPNWIDSQAHDRFFYLEYIIGKQKGEDAIKETLQSKMSDDYYLINGAVFEDTDDKNIRIPHVLLCPDGTIVCIESHNLEGKFLMGNNAWKRKLRTDDGADITEDDFTDMRSKSYHSAKKLHVNLGEKLKQHKIVALVVMTNSNSGWADKQESFCPIVRLKQLPDFLKFHYGQKKLEREENKESAMLLWSKTLGKAS